MDNANSEYIKTIYTTSTNLNSIVFTIETDERYFEKYDEFKDLESGMEFIVVDRPYINSRGKHEIRCKLLTKINALRYLRNNMRYV